MSGILGAILGALWKCTPWGLGAGALALVGVDEYAVAVLFWALAGTVYLRQRYVESAPERRDSRLFGAEILIVLSVVAVACAWTYTKKGEKGWTAFLPRDVVSSAKAPTPGSTVVPAPSTPVTPAMKTPGDRVIVNVNPDYLVGFFRQHTTAQAQQLAAVYMGKWMNLSGSVRNVIPLGEDKSRRILVHINTNRDDFLIVTAAFTEPRWMDRASTLRRGDRIIVLGKIRDIDSLRMTLYDCELQ